MEFLGKCFTIEGGLGREIPYPLSFFVLATDLLQANINKAMSNGLLKLPIEVQMSFQSYSMLMIFL
jgi:hypothetical protein